MDEEEKLEYSEFILISLNIEKFLDKEKLIYAFEYFDMDNSGYLDYIDIKNTILRTGREIIDLKDIEKMFSEITLNKKPFIYLDDFIRLFGYEINDS